MSKTLEILKYYFSNDLGKLIFNFSFNINKPFKTGYYEGILNIDMENYDYYNICKYNYRSILNYCINNFNIKLTNIISNELNLDIRNIKNITNKYLNLKLNKGLKGACVGGNIEIVKLMIQKGANNFNEGLREAYLYENIKIVELMIDHGADDFTEVFEYACIDGNIEIAKLMIDCGADDFTCGLKIAKDMGHNDIINLLNTYIN